MLFKKIVAVYGRSVSGQTVRPEDDIIHKAVPGASLISFRQGALGDISGAKIYLLDHQAANYADSFRESMQELKDVVNPSDKIISYMEEVELPADLVWVEHDHSCLMSDRFERGHEPDPNYTDPNVFGLSGFLFDNRSTEFLKISQFRSDGSGKVVDPLLYVQFSKSPSGKAQFSSFNFVLNDHMLDFYEIAGMPTDVMREFVDQAQSDIFYDMALGFVLFSLLKSPRSDVLTAERPSLTPVEAKTARKFGKTWLTEALRSHVTIRIGDEARAHLAEQAARKKFEQDVESGRLSPVEHWVSEHERRYKSGKIVLIKAHKRGEKIDPSVPTRVMGPRRSDDNGMPE